MLMDKRGIGINGTTSRLYVLTQETNLTPTCPNKKKMGRGYGFGQSKARAHPLQILGVELYIY